MARVETLKADKIYLIRFVPEITNCARNANVLHFLFSLYLFLSFFFLLPADPTIFINKLFGQPSVF